MNFCLYHASCMDGYAAAYCVWKVHGDEDMTYIPVQYGQELPSITQQPIEIIYIVDFSYSVDRLNYLADYCSQLVIIDHHKSAEKDLKDYDRENVVKIFDMNHSGCILTWNFFFAKSNPPKLLSCIEDRDIWKWKIEDSKEILCGLQLKMDLFSNFSNFEKQFDHLESLKEKGEVILAYNNIIVKRIAEKAAFYTDPHGNNYAIVNSCILQSEIGHALCLSNPNIKYASIFFDNINERKRIFSLRSIGDFDVSEVAKRYSSNSGGQRNSAGYALESQYSKW